MSEISRRFFLATSAASLMSSSRTVAQQSYPNRPIHLVSGFPAGSQADLLTRFFGKGMEQRLGQSVVVENRPGALGNIANNAVARSKPDGYTMLITSGSTMAGNSVMLKDLGFDVTKDIVPIASILRVVWGFGVPNASPYHSLGELTEALLKKGEAATYSYGSAFPLGATELYKQKTGVKARGVPFKSSSESWQSLFQGEVDFIIGDLTPFLSAAPKARPLAVTSNERFSILPNVPGAREAGLGDYEVSSFWALWVPAGTPPDIVSKLQQAFDPGVDSVEGRKFIIDALGAEPMVAQHEDVLSARLKTEMAMWQEFARIVPSIKPQ